jgi:hypothetical protein
VGSNQDSPWGGNKRSPRRAEAGHADRQDRQLIFAWACRKGLRRVHRHTIVQVHCGRAGYSITTGVERDAHGPRHTPHARAHPGPWPSHEQEGSNLGLEVPATQRRKGGRPRQGGRTYPQTHLGKRARRRLSHKPQGHSIPLPNPILYLGIPCALVKPME